MNNEHAGGSTTGEMCDNARGTVQQIQRQGTTACSADFGQDMKLHIKYFNELTVDELYAILCLRVSIFVVEQKCPYPELDYLDQKALHVWLEDHNGIAAYLRVLDRGTESEHVSIGRVLSVRRRRGIGSRILADGVKAARERFDADKIYLEAQSYAKGLYEKQGFRQISDEFLLDGIPHVKMILD